MIKRILTALVMVLVVFGFILGLRQVHPAILAGFVGVLSLAATYEMCDALKKAEYKTMLFVNMACALVTCVCAYFFSYMGIALSITVFVLLSLAIFTFDHKYELKDVIASIFIMFYPILPLALLVILNNSVLGLYAILLTVFIPVLTDTMAYFTGYLIGGPKLCPEISPKKTIAGAIGGIIGGILGAVIATFGCILPSLFLVSILAFVYYKYRSADFMQKILKVIRPVVVSLIAAAGIRILMNVAGIGESLDWKGVTLFAVALVSMKTTKINPILIMVACGVVYLILGIIFPGAAV